MIKKLIANKAALIVTSMIAVVLVGAAVYVKTTNTDNQATEVEEATPEVKTGETQGTNPGNQAKDKLVESENQPGNNGGSTTPAKPSVKPLITGPAQDETNVYIGARVDGATSGTCTLSLSKQGYSTINRTSELVLVVSYYACKDFVVAKSDFPVKGEWIAVVKFSSGSAEGTSDPVTVNVN